MGCGATSGIAQPHTAEVGVSSTDTTRVSDRGSLSPDVIKKLTDIFRLFDVNGNGYITWDEANDLGKRMCEKLNLPFDEEQQKRQCHDFNHQDVNEVRAQTSPELISIASMMKANAALCPVVAFRAFSVALI